MHGKRLQSGWIAVATAGEQGVLGASAHSVHVHHIRRVVALKQDGRQIQFGGNDDIVFTFTAGVVAAGAIVIETYIGSYIVC